MKNLGQKTILGFAQLVLIMGICLFAPSWTFDYWQAWVYLFVFIFSSAFITAYLWKKDPKLLERRVKGGPAAEKEKSQQVIQFFASIAFLGILILPALDRRFGWSYVPTRLRSQGMFWLRLVFLLSSWYLGKIRSPLQRSK